MAETDTRLLQDALTRCLRGDDGEIHASGRFLLNWLRDVVCEWREDPIHPDVYSGDLVQLGATLGRQSVYDRIIQQMRLQPELERIIAMEEALKRERMKLEEVTDV